MSQDNGSSTPGAAPSDATHESLRALQEMASPGYPWQMFTAAGNLACSAALADVVDRRDELTAATFKEAIEGCLVAVAEAGHREVGDTEPETEFAEAANHLAAWGGWPPITRWDLTAHQPVLDQANAADTAATKAATAALIEAHRDEFDALRAQHLNRQ